MGKYKFSVEVLMSFISKNKIVSSVVALVLVVAIALTLIITAVSSKNKDKPVAEISSQQESSSEQNVSSEEQASSEITLPVSSEEETVSSKKPVASSKPAASTVIKPQPGKYNYNTNLNIEDNVFMDALIYTGYNMEKHRADGNMWVYILANRKKALGYLSNISFGGGSTGFETTPDGKPNIKAFEKGGFVCASFVTYVYYNYLPNVAGIDTSSLARPDRSYSADSVYTAAKQWVAKGYSRYIGFTAKGTAQNYMTFNPNEEIPIGSILVFRNYSNPNQKTGSHVCIYAGKKNGMHWVYHTGNKNGPEMCAVERFLFGPDPQWPIAIITTPSNIRMSAAAEITVTDDGGKPIAGSSVTLKETATGKTISLGKTDSKGVAKKENLNYGEYTVIFTVPEGYTADVTSKKVNFTPAANSLNKVTFSVKTKAVESSAPASSDTVSSDTSSITE